MTHSRPIIFALVLISASVASVSTSSVSTRSDGANASISRLALQPAAQEALSGTLPFSADDGVHGGLLKSNGTRGGRGTSQGHHPE